MNVYEQRFANVVRALREAPRPKLFRMRSYSSGGSTRSVFVHNLFVRTLHWLEDGPGCGTPACVLGHYAARTDLQCSFRLSTVSVDGTPLRFGFEPIGFNSEPIRTHFGINYAECQELFGAQGCNDAQSTDEAIAYIEQFVARKWGAKPLRSVPARDDKAYQGESR